MAGPIPHHRATGIHPGAFVQPTAPDTTDVQDGVLWIDTSAGPPYQVKRWDASGEAGVWHPVQMDQTGYPLPGGHRLETTEHAGESVFLSVDSWSVPHDNCDGDEILIPGLDLTMTGPADSVTVAWGLTLHGGAVTQCILRLRRSDVAGETLWSQDVTTQVQESVGSFNVVNDSYTDSAPTDFHYVLTVQLTVTTSLSAALLGSSCHFEGFIDPTSTIRLLHATEGVQTVWPFPDLSVPPLQVLAKDPSDGLPKWSGLTTLVHKEDLPVDTGGQGQLPAADSALPDDPPAPTTLQTDKPLPPVALPDPIIDNCPIMRCGAAYYLAQKLKEQYDIVRNCLLGMLAAPLLLRIPAATAPMGITIFDLIIARLSDSLIGQYGADILWLTRIVTKLSRWSKVVGVSFSVARDFEDIHEEGNVILQRLAYPCLTCSENIFNLSQDMLVAWELAINADTADFTDWQRHLLVYILQCTPFGIYHTVAAQGAAITSDTCGGF